MVSKLYSSEKDIVYNELQVNSKVTLNFKILTIYFFEKLFKKGIQEESI